MSVTNYGQILLYCAIVGVLLGVLWDFFRILRYGFYGYKNAENRQPFTETNPTLLPSDTSAVSALLAFKHRKNSPLTLSWFFVCDLLFFVVAAFMVIVLLFAFNDGQSRLIAPIGTIFGFFCYYFTVGKLVISAAEAIINLSRRVTFFIISITFLPLKRLFLRQYLKFYLSLKSRQAASRTKKYISLVSKRAECGFFATHKTYK